MLTDWLHNIFGAGDGTVPPTVAAAAVYAMSVGQMFAARGASPQEVADAYKYAFGDAFGWTHEETDWYWSHHSEPGNFEDASVDAYDAYVDWARAHQIDMNMATMRGDGG